MAFDLAERRYIKETGVEARIARIVEPVAIDLGYSLVRVKVTQENGMTLQIMAEDANGRFTITDCERLSKRFRGFIADVDDEAVTIKLPDAPKGEDPNHRLPLTMLAEAKLVMTDALMNMAQVDQEDHPIDDDEDIETVELGEDNSETTDSEEETT